ncbi:unnamed protein product [marine sediment metagenome]|uniref:DUF6998 domain-containing protein n=1 Tax=marine sediment metagenome TaxID=412755 RepID=X1DM23_9ZZZZ
MRSAAQVAVDYERLTGRKLGITGEVGEVLACDKLGLKLLADPISAGYDAIDKDNKRYQIKTRRVEHNRGRLSRFSKHEFDYAILVVLNAKYEIMELWQADFRKIKPLIDRQKRRNPSMVEFKRLAERIS